MSSELPQEIRRAASVLFSPTARADQRAHADQFLTSLLSKPAAVTETCLAVLTLLQDSSASNELSFAALRILHSFIVHNTARFAYTAHQQSDIDLLARIHSVTWNLLLRADRPVAAKAAHLIAVLALRVESGIQNTMQVVLEAAGRVGPKFVGDVLVEVVRELRASEFVHFKKMKILEELKGFQSIVFEVVKAIRMAETESSLLALRVLETWTANGLTCSLGKLVLMGLLDIALEGLFADEERCRLAANIIVQCLQETTQSGKNLEEEVTGRRIAYSVFPQLKTHFNGKVSDQSWCAGIGSFGCDIGVLEAQDILSGNSVFIPLLETMLLVTQHPCFSVAEYGLEFWVLLQDSAIVASAPLKISLCREVLQGLLQKVILPAHCETVLDLEDSEGFSRFRELTGDQFVYLFLVLRREFLNVVVGSMIGSLNPLENSHLFEPSRWRIVEAAFFVLSSLIMESDSVLSFQSYLSQEEWLEFKQIVTIGIPQLYLKIASQYQEPDALRQSFLVFIDKYAPLLSSECDDLLLSLFAYVLKHSSQSIIGCKSFEQLCLSAPPSSILTDSTVAGQVVEILFSYLPRNSIFCQKLISSIAIFLQKRGFSQQYLPQLMEPFTRILHSIRDASTDSGDWHRALNCLSSLMKMTDSADVFTQYLDLNLIRNLSQSLFLDLEGHEVLCDFLESLMSSCSRTGYSKLSDLVLETCITFFRRFRSSNSIQLLHCCLLKDITSERLLSICFDTINSVMFPNQTHVMDQQVLCCTFCLLESIVQCSHVSLSLLQTEFVYSSINIALRNSVERNCLKRICSVLNTMLQDRPCEVSERLLQNIFHSLLEGICGYFSTDSIQLASKSFYLLSQLSRNYGKLQLWYRESCIESLNRLVGSSSDAERVYVLLQQGIEEFSCRKFTSMMVDIAYVARGLNTPDTLAAYMSSGSKIAASEEAILIE